MRLRLGLAAIAILFTFVLVGLGQPAHADDPVIQPQLAQGFTLKGTIAREYWGVFTKAMGGAKRVVAGRVRINSDDEGFFYVVDEDHRHKKTGTIWVYSSEGNKVCGPDPSVAPSRDMILGLLKQVRGLIGKTKPIPDPAPPPPIIIPASPAPSSQATVRTGAMSVQNQLSMAISRSEAAAVAGGGCSALAVDSVVPIFRWAQHNLPDHPFRWRWTIFQRLPRNPTPVQPKTQRF